MIKKISILGAGFAGLASAYYLASDGVKVHLYDPNGIGGGASAVSAGLLHPFAGTHAKCNWQGREGMEASSELITIAEEALGIPVAQRNGIIRLAISESQKNDYQKCAAQYDDVRWCEADEVKSLLPAVEPFPGIHIKSAMAVNVKLYLEGLWKACQKLGVEFTHDTLTDLSEPIIFTTGSSTLSFKELQHLPLTPIKGQILQLEWPNNLPPLAFPANSKSYIVMAPDLKSCWVGASFERNFTDHHVDIETAKREILPNAFEIIPELKNARILDCQAGIRMSTRDKHPLLLEIAPKKWVFTGLGSKGLLYHALFAKQLSKIATDEACDV